MVARRLWDQQTFADGQTRVYRWNWTVPLPQPPGRYTAGIVVLGLGWKVRHWNGDAGTFDIVSVSSTTSTSSTSSTTTTTSVEPTTTTSTRPTTSTTSTTSTTMPPPMECDGVPMETPIGALPPAMPMLCDMLVTGVASTFVNGANSWVDNFDHGASMAEMGPGYLAFERSSGAVRTGHFRHNNHWMVDVYAPGKVGGAQMRPDRSFRFQAGKLVVEAAVAAGIDEYFDMWPEITVTTASSPAASSLGRVGPTPARSIGDNLYAYGQFGGYDALGIRLTGNRPTVAYYDNTERGFSCGRLFELSWFQDGSGSCGSPRQFNIWGGGEWAAPGALRHCNGTDPDINCRDLFRWELTKTSITPYVNGQKYMEHTALPGFGLPDRFVNADLYVYFSDWVYQAPDHVVRYHWDRVAINP
jgi:hypothetical protein